MFTELQTVILGITVSIAIIGFFFSIKSWSSWRNIDDNTLRGRVFLTRKFLNRNFMLVFITGAFVAFHTILEFIEIFGYPSVLIPFAQWVRTLYFSTLTVSMFLLVLLAYFWFKLVSTNKR